MNPAAHGHHSDSISGPAALALGSGRSPMTVDFDRSPFVVAWEITRACALACRHCRAEAQPHRHPDELTAAEGIALIDQIADMGAPLLILTGGDPMLRKDLPDLIAHARSRGLMVALSPSATPRVTRARLEACRDAGVGRIAISLDGSCPEIHDTFRGFDGVFDRTIAILETLRDVGLTLQLGTTVCRTNLRDLERIAAVATRYGAVMWSLFFLVPTGRGQAADVIDADQHEEVFNWLHDFAATAPFDVRTTAAPQYRRVVIERHQEPSAGTARHLHSGFRYSSAADGIPRSALGVNDGRGFCFVNHLGEIQPSGFLPLTAGRFPQDAIAGVYRDSDLFRQLRDPDLLEGKCGRCHYRAVCGGSRARAYAFTGNYLAEEPRCAYIPA